MEACWLPLVVLVAVEFWLVWSVVDGVVEGLVWLGCCWSGVVPGVLLCEPLDCANAMPVVSISANTNFLFMSLLLRSFAPRGRSSFLANVR